MTWKDRLMRASFRGVVFHVDSSEMEAGRRVELIRLAGVRDVVPQEMGDDPRSFTLTAYVVGLDYDGARTELEDALNEPGPGMLVVPTRGPMEVVVSGKYKVSESRKEGGVARFQIPFVETATALTPLVEVDAGSLVKDYAATVNAKVVTEFSSRFSTAALSSGDLAALKTTLSNATFTIARARGATLSVGATPAAIATLAGDIVGQLDTLMSTPEALASQMIGLARALYADARNLAGSVERVTGLVRYAVDAASALRFRRAAEDVMRTIAETQDTGIASGADDNSLAFRELSRVASFAAGCEALADLPLDSYDTANAVSGRLVDVFDDLETTIASDDTLGALADLRGAMAVHLAGVAASLPRLRKYAPTTTAPALLVAHHLYGDASREAELLARNPSVSHPLFVTSGVTLEVLGA